MKQKLGQYTLTQGAYQLNHINKLTCKVDLFLNNTDTIFILKSFWKYVCLYTHTHTPQQDLVLSGTCYNSGALQWGLTHQFGTYYSTASILFLSDFHQSCLQLQYQSKCSAHCNIWLLTFLNRCLLSQNVCY